MVYQLYDSAFRILDIRNNLLENFTGSRKQIIDLAASTIPSSYLLPELLAGFGRMYPDVYFHSWQTDSSGAINRVLDGTVDLALTGQNTGDDSCVFIPFCQDNMVIATPVNDHYLNLKQKEQPVVFQDFIKDPVIIREKGSGTKKEMDIFLENAGIEPSSLNVVARMNDLESIKKSIVNGLGFSILSARSVVDLQKNIMAAAWSMPVEFEPPRVAIVVDKSTWTRELIERNGKFGIVIPGVAATNWTWAVGSVSGREEDKFNCYGIPVVRGPVLGLPLVEEKCLAWMECRLLPATSAQEKYDTLFGEVVSAAADARVFVEGRWQFDDDKLNTLHHLGAGTFVTSGKRVTAG